MLVDVLVFGPDPTNFDSVRGNALIDTGATVSGIGPRIINELGLHSYGKKPLGSATEERMVEYYLFRLGFPPHSGPNEQPEWPHIFERTDGFSWARPTEFDVILGMDVLLECDLRVNRHGKCQLRYGPSAQLMSQ